MGNCKTTCTDRLFTKNIETLVNDDESDEEKEISKSKSKNTPGKKIIFYFLAPKISFNEISSKAFNEDISTLAGSLFNPMLYIRSCSEGNFSNCVQAIVSSLDNEELVKISKFIFETVKKIIKI